MKTVSTLSSLVFLFAGLLRSSAQYYTIQMTGPSASSVTNFSIPSGKVADFILFTRPGAGSSWITAASGTNTPTDLSSSIPCTIAGPATISLKKGVDSAVLCTYKIYDNSTAQACPLPSTAIVIPADAVGPVQIILESSIDLVSWNSALPGTYGGSTTSRFFRVRAALQ